LQKSSSSLIRVKNSGIEMRKLVILKLFKAATASLNTLF
jgi:hypothetical protein